MRWMVLIVMGGLFGCSAGDVPEAARVPQATAPQPEWKPAGVGLLKEPVSSQAGALPVNVILQFGGGVLGEGYQFRMVVTPEPSGRGIWLPNCWNYKLIWKDGDDAVMEDDVTGYLPGYGGDYGENEKQWLATQ